jgi:hypothetical protein
MDSRIGFIGFLTALFIGLKLIGAISWSWVWVLAPIWIYFVAVLFLFTLAVIFAVREK